MMIAVGWLCCCAMAMGASAYELEVGETGIVFRTELDDRPQPLLAGVGYRANDDKGMAFETRGAALGEGGRLVFALQGPAAEDASVEAKLVRLARGFSLDWTIKYSGPERAWNPWTSGLRFDFPREITAVAAQAVTKWVEPTGEHPWEVAGDTLYPNTECQVRQVVFGDVALMMVASAYDGDWIYGNNKERARNSRLSLPRETPCERTVKLAFLAVRTDDLDPERLAAEAAGRPVALSVTTGRVGNLFDPAEPVRFDCLISNVTEQPQDCTVSLEGWTYGGRNVLSESQELSLEARGRGRLAFSIRPGERGIVFLISRLKWDGGETAKQTTFGIIPDRSAADTAPESPFGMAAVIASPDRYPDQYDLPRVLGQMERIGVRWIRSGWFPFKSDITEADEQRTRRRVALLREHGILPHVQLGSSVPAPEDLEDYKERLATCLRRFGWVSPYVEVGNELNHGGISGSDYVEKMLRPIQEVMRETFPTGKMMSMGLGGIMKGWLDGFVGAGGMELVDVLSVHPGCHPRAPEFWEGWRGWVFRSQMLDAMKAAREHGNKEVWLTEGYAPAHPERTGLDLRTSADYLVRTYVCSLALGVKVIEWYQFQDGVWFARRQDPADIDYNFGVVYTDLTPKPAYVAYGTMTELLEGAVCEGRVDLGSDDLYGVRFAKDGANIDVLWSYREKHETDIPWWPPENYKDDSRKPGEPWVNRWNQPVAVELPAPGSVSVRDIMGNSRKLEPEEGKVTLELTGSPVYVTGLSDLALLPRLWDDIE